MKARLEYLRALRYELRALPEFDQVQVCTKANADYLLSFLPRLAPKVRAGLRAGIETARYRFRAPRARAVHDGFSRQFPARIRTARRSIGSSMKPCR